MALVTFNENIDHYVKGDVVDLDAAETKRIDAYAKAQGIEKPYAKGAKKVSNTSDAATLADQARERSLETGGKENGNVKTDEDAGTLLKDDDDQTAADKLVENANKQAVGETLPGQEGDNPSELDESDAITDEDAGTEGVPAGDVIDEANRQAGAGEVEGDDNGSDEGSDDSESDDETDAATELENDNDEPAQGTEKAKPATAPAKK